MEIIIDGYNLIGIDQTLRGPLERKRDWLLQRLSMFNEGKAFETTVVFDGWQSGSPRQVEERRGDLKVIFSRLGETADSVIVRAARGRGSGCLVVTSDREIRANVEKFGAISISSGEFAEILRDLDMPYRNSGDYGGAEPERAKKRGNPRQLSKTERRRAEILRKLRS